ncbi:MAG: hypothetical protein WC889_02760 [Myxococcota bacterium]|jgi:hypothetical protein
MTDEPHISYYGMGAWPAYVGCTTSRKAFKRELKRLGIAEPVEFLASTHANASTHFFRCEGTLTCIIAFQKVSKDRPVEQVAALVAHEAVHVVQELWSSIGETEPGREAEAYLVQMITQCCLQDILDTGRSRKETP